jgi:hypothetical protein
MFISKFIYLFIFFLSGENKKILLQSGKAFPKGMWWKIGATFLISLGGGTGVRCLVFCNIFEGDLGEPVFQQNITSFMKSENRKKKKKGKKSILCH